jgi:hypothetical protein
VAPTWKFCIHCGLAVEQPEIAGANDPADVLPARRAASSRALIAGGVGIFLVGIALLVVAIAFFAGAFR